MTRTIRAVPIDPHRDQIEAAYPLIEGMQPRKAKELCRKIYAAMIEHAPQQRIGGLTPNQRKLHEVLTEELDRTNICPTLRELALLAGFCDHTQAFRSMKALRRKGIVFTGSGPRDVTLLKRPDET